MTEAQFQQIVLDLANMSRWMTYHTHDSRKSHKGFPDLTLVRPPRVIFAELKGDGAYGKRGLTREQAVWVDALQACPGVEAYVWRPDDLNDIATILARRTTNAPQEHARHEAPQDQDDR
jgi:hypothetical protein